MALLYQSRRRRLRRNLLLAVLTLALVGAGVAGWKWGVPRYKDWKQQRALTQAREFLEQRDPANAKLALDVALVTVPGNPNAWRVAAEILEQVREPRALRLRRRVVQMLPDSVEDKLALVRCSLLFSDVNAARDALAELTPEQANTPEALQVALAFALDTSNAAVADALFDRLKTSVDDESFVISQTLLHLRHPDPTRVAGAKEELAEFARQSRHHLRISRELTGYALTQGDTALARTWAQEAVNDPEAQLHDHLTLANLRLLVDGVALETLRASLDAKAAASDRTVESYARWLMVQNKAAEADAWVKTLPAEMRAEPLVRAVEAELAAALSDWDRLGELLEAGAWGAVSQPTVRLAMATRLVAERDNPGLRRDMWNEALRAAAARMVDLRALIRLAGVWGWDNETRETLWQVLQSFPDQSWAFQALYNEYRSTDNAAGMLDVMNRMRRENQDVPRFEHDAALLSMLLERDRTWNRAKESVEKLYYGEPDNPHYATSYAFALALADRPDEAIRVVEQMPSALRDYAARAPYLAYVYAAAGQQADMQAALARTENVRFMKEEQQLLKDAPQLASRGLRQEVRERVEAARDAARTSRSGGTEAADHPNSGGSR